MPARHAVDDALVELRLPAQSEDVPVSGQRGPLAGVRAACDSLGVARASFSRQRPLSGPVPAPPPAKAHEGTIVTEQPDLMWGADPTTQTITLDHGSVTIFVAVEHCTAECIGIHAVK
jgi:hypothetical protein